MSEYTTVAKVREIPEGHGTSFLVAGRVIAVFNECGTFYAIDDTCPHAGASLAKGDLENGVVTCPRDGWRFCIHDGTWCDNRRLKIDHFDVRVAGDDVQVRVPLV
jgi:nitrite reductase (NADH) small subunit/3-phenylpropionate/trans-cinnamate dioxygenase ferredoxin subunit